MKLMKITAIFNESLLPRVESVLESHGVNGFTIHPVKGRGSYCNTYSRDHLIIQTQIEIYTIEKFTKPIRNLLIEAADIGIDAEGLVAVTEVSELTWIYQKTSANENDFNFYEVENGI